MLLRSSPPTVLISVLGTLCACAAPPKSVEDLPAELRQSSVVSIHDASFPVPDTGTYSWMPQSEVLVDERFDAPAMDLDLRAALEDSLHRRGYVLVPEQKGQFWVGYLLVLEGAVPDRTLDEKYGLEGDLSPGDSQRYERGALVVDVVDRVARRGVWRGSIAALVDPTLPGDVRRERLNRGVERLLERFKLGY